MVETVETDLDVRFNETKPRAISVSLKRVESITGPIANSILKPLINWP